MYLLHKHLGAGVFERPAKTMDKFSVLVLPIVWCCVWAHFPFPGWFLSTMASRHFGCFWTQKTPLFGPTWTWNVAWMGYKSVWHIFSYCLWCVLTLFPLSRLIILSIMASPHLGCFWTPNHPFLDPPGPGVTPGWGIKVSDRSLPIAWGVVWTFNLFPGWFFVNYGTLSFWLFLTWKYPFLGPPGPGMIPGWGIKVSNTPFPIAWGVFWPIFQFPGGLLGWYGSLPPWSILTQKMDVFRRPPTWNGTWRGAKRPQTTFPHV